MKGEAPMFVFQPEYKAHPEGTAPFEKIISLGKKAIFFAVGIGAMDCIYITEAKTPLETVNCMAYWLVPSVGLSTMWASTTFISTRVRGKDDVFNYLVGVASCMPILHAWQKSLSFTLWTSATAAAAAYLAKGKGQEGWRLVPPVIHQDPGVAWGDFTLTKKYDKDFRTPYRLGW